MLLSTTHSSALKLNTLFTSCHKDQLNEKGSSLTPNNSVLMGALKNSEFKFWVQHYQTDSTEGTMVKQDMAQPANKQEWVGCENLEIYFQTELITTVPSLNFIYGSQLAKMKRQIS